MAKDTEIKEKEEINVNNSNEDLLAKITAAQKELDAKAEELNKKILELEEKSKAIDEKTLEIDNKLKEIPEKELKNESISTGEALKKEKKVTIVVPKSELNPKDKMVPVTINGYTYRIIRGEEVEVPVTVKNILKEAKYL